MDGLMARAAPRGRQIPDVPRLSGGNHTPRHTGTPNPSLAGGVKPAREMSGTALRTGGRAENGSRSRTIQRGLGASAMSFAMVSGRYSRAPDLATIEESVMTATGRGQA